MKAADARTHSSAVVLMAKLLHTVTNSNYLAKRARECCQAHNFTAARIRALRALMVAVPTAGPKRADRTMRVVRASSRSTVAVLMEKPPPTGRTIKAATIAASGSE